MGIYFSNPILEAFLMAQISIFIFINSAFINLYMFFRGRQFKKWSEKPPVSVIIPSYNKASILEKTIKSVLALNYPRKEVIVVNDGSTDNTIEVCKKFVRNKKIKLISYKKNRGKANALNAGIKAAKHEIILTIDADSFPRPNSLSRLIEYFSDPEVGAVSGTLKVFNQKKMLTSFQALEYIHQGFQRFIQGLFGSVMVTPGPLTAYRKSALAKVGYFDDDTLVEDWDIGLKLQKAGYKNIAEKKAVVFTVAPDTFKDWWKQRIRWGRGGFQVTMKHFDILFNRDKKMLGTFFFPLQILWLIIPFTLIVTTLLVLIPDPLILQKLWADIMKMNLVIDFKHFNFMLLFRNVEGAILDYIDIPHLDLIRILGYVSVSLFLIFTTFSLKVTGEKFKPKTFKILLFISLYWLLNITVFMGAVFKEVFSKKREWY